MRAMGFLAGFALLILFLLSKVRVALMMICNVGAAFRQVSRMSRNGRTVSGLKYQCGNTGQKPIGPIGFSWGRRLPPYQKY